MSYVCTNIVYAINAIKPEYNNCSTLSLSVSLTLINEKSVNQNGFTGLCKR